MSEPIVEKLAFEQSDRGYSITAYYLETPKADALVEIKYEETMIRKFIYPAYKIWNLAAHFSDIVDSEIVGNMDGYEMASWCGI
jgi:type II restriction/modification system DNA methylase subunit YeeA